MKFSENKNTIRDVDMVHTVDTVYTVDTAYTFYTIDTALHCVTLLKHKHAFLYILLGKVRTLL